MGVISVLWGIVSLIWTLLALIPLLGWGNWFMIPFAVFGLLIGAIGYLLTQPALRGRARLGMTLNVVAIVIGVVRLMIGGGLI